MRVHKVGRNGMSFEVLSVRISLFGCIYLGVVTQTQEVDISTVKGDGQREHAPPEQSVNLGLGLGGSRGRSNRCGFQRSECTYLTFRVYLSRCSHADADE